MDRATGIFVDGIGAAAATSGILTQLQGRIFALLYLQQRPLSLDEIATESQQSKSSISVNIRGLLDWHLVRLTRLPNSRKDHYEAATDFWRVMQEIIERRFRWNLRQMLAAATETQQALEDPARRGRRGAEAERIAFIASRLEGLHAFFSALDAGIGAFAQGQSLEPDAVRGVLGVVRPRRPERP